MSLKKIDVRTLDQILEKMINTVDSSKSEIFQIGEQCRQEYETLSDELKEVKVMVSQVIDEGEDLEVKLVSQEDVYLLLVSIFAIIQKSKFEKLMKLLIIIR